MEGIDKFILTGLSKGLKVLFINSIQQKKVLWMSSSWHLSSFNSSVKSFPSSAFHKLEQFSTNILDYLLNVILKSWLAAIDLVHNYGSIQKGD